jgi:WhiB family transcriptional regulator, redox-sensing transcriptional regulator
MVTPRHHNIGRLPTNDQSHTDPAEVVTAADAGPEYFAAALTRGRPAWFAQAACRGMDPNLFHPSLGRPPKPEALQACGRCPVRLECLRWANELDPTAAGGGLYGGMDAAARRAHVRAATRRAQEKETS